MWNVNIWRDKSDRIPHSVLIETLWNVNEIELLICIKFQKRINRNIVECKCLRHSVMNSRKSVLIETLWNVNKYERLGKDLEEYVLIETLWNVNVDTVVFNALRALY